MVTAWLIDPMIFRKKDVPNRDGCSTTYSSSIFEYLFIRYFVTIGSTTQPLNPTGELQLYSFVLEQEEQKNAFLHIVLLVRATYFTFTAREQTLSDPYSYRMIVLGYKP
ncbi:hypothetical protein ACFE04_024034 [Oxalis oulophora]